jgi:hypothetical protein
MNQNYIKNILKNSKNVLMKLEITTNFLNLRLNI